MIWPSVFADGKKVDCDLGGAPARSADVSMSLAATE
jgi:hypothetical protein